MTGLLGRKRGCQQGVFWMKYGEIIRSNELLLL